MRFVFVSALIVLLVAPEVPAQNIGEEAYPDKYPPALPSRKGPPPPKVAFELLGELPLPGPLSEAPLAAVDGRLLVTLAEGTGWVAPGEFPSWTFEAGTLPAPKAPDPPGPNGGWVLSPSGDLRFRIDAEGRIRAQRRSRFSEDGWRKAWTIRTPRAMATPPLILGPRLYYSGLDDRIYAVRASNGHRLWAVDVGEPFSRPLVHWSGTIPTADRDTGTTENSPLDVLLVVPDGGGTLRAFDVYDGSASGSYLLPGSRGWLASSPFIVNDGRVAVARQGYVPGDAALALFELRPIEAEPAPDIAVGEGESPPPL